MAMGVGMASSAVEFAERVLLPDMRAHGVPRVRGRAGGCVDERAGAGAGGGVGGRAGGCVCGRVGTCTEHIAIAGVLYCDIAIQYRAMQCSTVLNTVLMW
jgi:hypothetical protein